MADNWDDDDDFLFDDDEVEQTGSNLDTPPWIMLIVDDEPGIHDITKVALQRFSFDARPIELLSAFNGEEALKTLADRNDIAVVLLDVVMETDHAGLDCARRIRDELQNEDVRIVLRTGQPGQAPEEDVILAFDINDYRAKTELTAQRLFTTVVAALRSYRDILALNKYREDAYALLSENTQTIQSLIDHSDQPLFQIGLNLTIQRCNTAFANILDEKMDKLIGVSLNQIQGMTVEPLGNDDIVVKYNSFEAKLETVKRMDGSITCYTGLLA